MPVLGLTVVLADASPERFRAALTLAAAQAAISGRVRLFCQGDAVGVLCPPIAVPDDGRHAAAGLPTLADLIDDALALGVEIVACQSGLALGGLVATDLDPRIGFGGPVAILKSLGEDRLVVV